MTAASSGVGNKKKLATEMTHQAATAPLSQKKSLTLVGMIPRCFPHRGLLSCAAFVNLESG